LAFERGSNRGRCFNLNFGFVSLGFAASCGQFSHIFGPSIGAFSYRMAQNMEKLPRNLRQLPGNRTQNSGFYAS
jgi:hypothetical protein